MPNRLRVKNIQDNADLLADLNICADDPRLYNWINAFESQALQYGRWWGTTQLVKFCLSDSGCLVLPRQIATIEAANLGSRHASLRNSWYEFIKPHELCDSGCGTRGCGCGCGSVNIQDSGTVASFRTTTAGQVIRVYPGHTSDVGKKIIFQGNDENGIWVRSTIDGIRQDGEEVTLALPYVDTVTVWGAGAPFAVMKEETNYRVLVYAVTEGSGPAIDNPYLQSDTDSLWYQFNAAELSPGVAIVDIGQTAGSAGTNAYLVLTDLDDGLKYKVILTGTPNSVFWAIDGVSIEDETPTIIGVDGSAYDLNTAGNGTTLQLTETDSPTEDVETLIAEYEPTETEPAYRRVSIPGYCSSSTDRTVGRCATTNCGTRTLSAIVSLDKIKVQIPNDWLMFTNEEVYRYGMQSIKARKDGNYDLADAFFFGTPKPSKAIRGPSRYADGMGALPLLRAELRRYTSDLTSINIQTDSLNLAGFR
jgi:hypothetical protein